MLDSLFSADAELVLDRIHNLMPYEFTIASYRNERWILQHGDRSGRGTWAVDQWDRASAAGDGPQGDHRK